MPRRMDLEQKALQVIAGNGREGVLQSELWRELEGSSREGSRIALKLESKGLIRREKELSNGRWTYRLYPKRLPASIDSIANCPCLLCKENSRCGASGRISPQNCGELTEWLMLLTKGEFNSLGDS